jgi:hypothetical protein
MDRRPIFPKQAALILMLLALEPLLAVAEASPMDGAKIERLTGMKGKLNEQEGIFKIGTPRDDLHVSVAGVKMMPPMGLTSWTGLARTGSQTQVTGDVVLLEDRVNPVMSVALGNGAALDTQKKGGVLLPDKASTPKVLAFSESVSRTA